MFHALFDLLWFSLNKLCHAFDFHAFVSVFREGGRNGNVGKTVKTSQAFFRIIRFNYNVDLALLNGREFRLGRKVGWYLGNVRNREGFRLSRCLNRRPFAHL